MVGAGTQYMSWVTLDDVLGAIHHALITDTVHGIRQLPLLTLRALCYAPRGRE